MPELTPLEKACRYGLALIRHRLGDRAEERNSLSQLCHRFLRWRAEPQGFNWVESSLRPPRQCLLLTLLGLVI